MKKIALTSLLLSLMVVGGVALAQGPMMHRMPGPDGDAGFYSHIADMLDLTADQKDAAKQIHEATFEKAKPIMEQHHAQMEEIESLLDSGNVSAQEIGTKVIAAHATRTQLKAIHEEAMAQFKALLTDEQKAKFEKMEDFHSDMKVRMHH
ncbi:MAG: Spy/CpxP family protein refolding chaperone [Acidobacteriota bacterium]